MTNVEVPSALERHAARRTFPLLARTKVCRSLFGPVDHEELNREMKQKLQEISESERSRWNFNFENSSPLPGNYEWEEVGARCVPAFYRDSGRCGVKPRTALSIHVKSDSAECTGKNVEQEEVRPAAEVNQENRSGALNGTPTCARKKRRSRSVQESPRSSSTHITDFFPKRKRSVDASSSIPVEITPRKRIR